MVVLKLIAKDRCFYVGPFQTQGEARQWMEKFQHLCDDLVCEDATEMQAICE